MGEKHIKYQKQTLYLLFTHSFFEGTFFSFVINEYPIASPLGKQRLFISEHWADNAASRWGMCFRNTEIFTKGLENNK